MICDWKDMVTEEYGIMVTDLMVLLFCILIVHLLFYLYLCATIKW